VTLRTLELALILAMPAIKSLGIIIAPGLGGHVLRGVLLEGSAMHAFYPFIARNGWEP
jgi:hypothetical protein